MKKKAVKTKKTTAKKKPVVRKKVAAEIPFVPDYHMLEQRMRQLTDQEAAAVGLALYHAATLPTLEINRVWAAAAKMEALRE